MTKTESIAGWVQKVVHSNGDFYVLRLFVEETGKSVAARGNLYGLLQVLSGVPIELTGTWRKHAKYGNQFAIRSWEPWAKKPEDVERFLHLCVEGFHADRDLSRKVASLGLGAFGKLSEGSDAVLAALGFPEGHEGLQRAILGWQIALSLRDLSGLLKTGGLGALDIQAAMTRFGTAAATVIQENPYRLMEVLPDFPKVDRLAMRLGFDIEVPPRMQGAVLWAVREESRQGHLFLPRGTIAKSLDELVSRNTLMALPEVSVDEAVGKLVEQGALVLESGTGVYLPDLYTYERESAKLLARMCGPADIDVDFTGFLIDYERNNKIQLSNAQREAVESLGKHKVLVLTGLPGTGKTMSVRSFVRLFDKAKMSFALMAPTGIAAKRLAAMTGREASTIHRALRYDGECWGLNKNNRYIVDAVIVDELSMVDQELFFRLLTALMPETVLVLVGDDAQLPSVGPGNVLRELVASEIPSVRLTQIFRQSVKGEIVTNSHRINRGEMPVLVGAKEKSEFRFIRLSDEDRIVDLIVGMAAKLKSRDANFQILSPKYEGTVGVNNLNEMLRDRLNPPGPKEWKCDHCHFRLGDRLMVIKNDYKRSVYNGDMGKLVGIGQEDLTVKIHGVGPGDLSVLVQFPFDAAADRLKLAYAISIHKSQGNDFDTVILPVVKSQGRMLQRNLLYTAVTRARKRVWLIGEDDAIRKAVGNNQVIQRNTVLANAVGVEIGHGERRDG